MVSRTSGPARQKGFWAWIEKHHRTVVIVSFHRRYLLHQFAGLIGVLVVMIVVVFVPSIIALLSSNSDSRAEAANRFLALHDLAWPLLALVLPLVGCVMVLNTHRFAGPLYRFRRVFDEVGRGVLTMRVKTRKRDYLHPEASGLDRMIVALRERIATAQTELARAHDEATELARQEPLVPAASVTALAESIGRARAVLDQFETHRHTRINAAHEGKRVGGAEHAVSGSKPAVVLSRSRGFTLVELLVVMLLIGTVASVAVPTYERALEKARVTRAAGEVRTIAREAQLSRLQKGCLPSSLAEAKVDYLRDPWGRPYQYGVVAQPNDSGPPFCSACSGVCLAVGQARTDGSLVPLNSDFDVYSAGRDGVSAGPVSAPSSADDILRANDGGYVGLGREY